jgi:hypothetical protein
MANAIMMLTCFLSFGFKVNEDTFMRLLGDDNFCALLEKITDLPAFFTKLSAELERRFNAKLNISKCFGGPSTDGMKLLGYVMQGTNARRDELELIAKLLFPERFQEPSQMMARTIGISWAAAGKFRRLYDCCKDLYKFYARQGITPDGRGNAWILYQGTTTGIDFSKFPKFEETFVRLADPPRMQPSTTWSSEFLSTM